MDLRTLIHIVFFLIRAKFSNYFSDKWKVLRVISVILLFFTLMGYICLSDALINSIWHKYNTHVVIFYIDCALVFLTLMRTNFPSFKDTKYIIPVPVPIDTWIKNIIDIIYDLVTPYFVFIFFYLGGLFIINPFFNTSHLLLSLSLLLYAFFLNKRTKIIISNNIVVKRRWLDKIGLGIYFLFLFASLSLIYLLTETIVTLFLTLISLLILIYDIVTKNRPIILSDNNGVTYNLYFNLIFKNKRLTTPLIYSFSYKVIVLTVFSIYYHHKGRFIFGDFVYWGSLSPIIIYSYYLNNFYGFNKELFLTHRLSMDDCRNFKKLFYMSAFILLILDILIVLPVIIINGQLGLENILFYLGTFFVMMLIGMITTLRFPSVVLRNDNSIFSRQNVPIVSNVLSVASLVLVYFLKSNIFYELLVIIITCAGIFISSVFIKIILTLSNYKLYNRLYT